MRLPTRAFVTAILLAAFTDMSATSIIKPTRVDIFDRALKEADWLFTAVFTSAERLSDHRYKYQFSLQDKAIGEIPARGCIISSGGVPMGVPVLVSATLHENGANDCAFAVKAGSDVARVFRVDLEGGAVILNDPYIIYPPFKSASQVRQSVTGGLDDYEFVLGTRVDLREVVDRAHELRLSGRQP